jgi:hypothetical protein
LRTTTRSSSRLLPKIRSSKAIALCIPPLCATLLLGCVQAIKPEAFFQLTPESLKNRALQTRIFETTNEKELLSASAAVLQDLGFQVEESEVDMGILRAAKERSAREFWQEFRRVLVALLSSGGRSQGGANTTVILPVDLHQQIGATLATRPLEGDDSRYTVRIFFHRTLWKGDGQSGDQYIPPGANRMEMISDGQIYQQFFAKLSKGLFLEAHEI